MVIYFKTIMCKEITFNARWSVVSCQPLASVKSSFPLFSVRTWRSSSTGETSYPIPAKMTPLPWEENQGLCVVNHF